MFEGTPREDGDSGDGPWTRHGVDRVVKYAFELAKSRPKKHLTSATKSNGISITMPYWDARVAEMAKGYQEVRVDKYHIDILTAHFVLRPQIFDVIVGSNLFGDILSDLGPACTGTIGIAPSGNINPSGEFPSLFEPVHGFCARHLRQRHRESRGHDLGGTDDARNISVVKRRPRRC